MGRVFQLNFRTSDPETGLQESLTDLSSEDAAFAREIRARYQMHVATLGSADLDGILRFFTPDAIWLAAGYPPRIGSSELRALFAETAHIGSVEVESLYAYVNQQTGWNIVNYHISPFDRNTAPWTFRTQVTFVRPNATWLANSVISYTLQSEA
ncbi:MAG TPA: nuclear transport factor 2 family protein [Phenylobacterium sp.]|uniref:YybH family protein n=1 Tax=Phenylobacterium sp. TaxID=1871053 RepID=UPI002B4AA4D5|nr:nuclear transport factor 2 family protein [Phenylobacterium sp.]HKR87114.1 nuclear transport factor 2 family protein [Phenylobacterium sp.]